MATKISRQHVVISSITDLHLEETVSEKFCHTCGGPQTHQCPDFKRPWVRGEERRKRLRGTGILNKVLDVTYTQIRKTEAESEQTRKSS